MFVNFSRMVRGLVSRKAVPARRRTQKTSYGSEALEVRVLPAVGMAPSSITTDHFGEWPKLINVEEHDVTSVTVEGGQQGIVLVEFSASMSGRHLPLHGLGFAGMKDVYVLPTPGTSFEYVASAELRMDANRDGFFETTLASTVPEYDMISFSDLHSTFIGARRPGDFQVVVTMGESVYGSAIGGEVAQVNFSQLGKPVSQDRIGYYGLQDPVLFPIASADLATTTFGPTLLHEGAVGGYGVTVANEGNTTARNVAVGVVVPGNMFWHATSSTGWYQDGYADDVVYYHVGDVQPGQSVTTEAIGLGADWGLQGVSSEIVGYAYSYTQEADDSNNSSRITTEVPVEYSDTSITLAGPATALENERVSYTFSVTNFGPEDAEWAAASLHVPEGFTFVASASDASLYQYEGHNRSVELDMFDLKAGQIRTVVAAFDVDSSVTGSQQLYAYAYSANTDTNSANDKVFLTTTFAPPVPSTQLYVTVKSIGSSDTAVENEKNVNLLRFETFVNEGTDVLFTGAEFQAQTGDAQNAYNYTLWVDADRNGSVDTILQKGVPSQNSLITFNSLTGGGYVSPVGQTTVFEVHADIASSLTSNTDLQLQFAAGSQTVVEAETVTDGASLNGIDVNAPQTPASNQIHLWTQDSKVYHLVSQGNLFVFPSSTPVFEHRYLAGTVGTIERIVFRAENEDVAPQVVHIGMIGDTRAISGLQLRLTGSETYFASATRAATGNDVLPTTYQGQSVTYFTARMFNQELVAHDGQDTQVVVDARFNTDVDGAVSGDHVGFVLVGDPAYTIVQAVGVSSSNLLAQNNGDAVANGEIMIGRTTVGPNLDIFGYQQTVEMSAITNAANGNPDADNTNNVPVGMSSVGQFVITAAPSAGNFQNGDNKAVLGSTVFVVKATNVSIDLTSFKVYNKADASTQMSVPISGVVQTSPGVYTVTVSGLSSSAVNTVINPGSSATFVLAMNVTNPKVNNALPSEVMVSLNTGLSTVLDRDFGSSQLFVGLGLPVTLINSTHYHS